MGRGWEAMEQSHSVSSNSRTVRQGAAAEPTTAGGYGRSQRPGWGRGFNAAGWSMMSNGVPWNRAAKAGMKGHVGGGLIFIGGENTCTSFSI